MNTNEESKQAPQDFRLSQAVHHRRIAKAARDVATKFNTAHNKVFQPGWENRYWDLWMMGELHDEIAASLETELGLEYVKPEERQ